MMSNNLVATSTRKRITKKSHARRMGRGRGRGIEVEAKEGREPRGCGPGEGRGTGGGLRGERALACQVSCKFVVRTTDSQPCRPLQANPEQHHSNTITENTSGQYRTN